MTFEDLKYLCLTTGNLASIPIRIYKDSVLLYYYSLVELPKDPITPYEQDILKIGDHLGYFITPSFHYYGTVNSPEYKIVMGPSRQLRASKDDLRELAFECNVSHDEMEHFIFSMESLLPLPLNSIIQMLCSFNLILNGEKLSLTDFAIHESQQEDISRQIQSKELEKEYDELGISSSEQIVHNTFTIEENMLNIVSHGDVSALIEWTKNAPAVRSGILSNDTLRQTKNTFIVTATLVSRAAIRGGMDFNDALALSDAYIQKAEFLSSLEELSDLQFHMVLDYTERVEKIRIGKNPSKFLKDVSNYVQKHLSEPVDIEKMAKELYFSRTHLATKFKAETNMTLTDFVLNAKTSEAKRLLRYSDKPISSIALYLGFSSQSHFSNAFKKYASLTPNEYRKKHKK